MATHLFKSGADLNMQGTALVSLRSTPSGVCFLFLFALLFISSFFSCSSSCSLTLFSLVLLGA
jgi:hypothetical protein